MSRSAGFTLRFLVKRVPAFVFRWDRCRTVPWCPMALPLHMLTHIVSLSREVENYTYDQKTSMSRRDRRPGQQTGDLSHKDGGVQVDIKWGDPYAGKPAFCA